MVVKDGACECLVVKRAVRVGACCDGGGRGFIAPDVVPHRVAQRALELGIVELQREGLCRLQRGCQLRHLVFVEFFVVNVVASFPILFPILSLMLTLMLIPIGRWFLIICWLLELFLLIYRRIFCRLTCQWGSERSGTGWRRLARRLA